MSATPELDLLTKREVAELLKVCEVMVTRWLKQGRLPAYPVGPRAVRVRRADVEGLIEPVSSAASANERVENNRASPWQFGADFTDEDIERGRKALFELELLGERIASRRGGRPLSDSAELIRNERERRSRQLYEAARDR